MANVPKVDKEWEMCLYCGKEFSFIKRKRKTYFCTDDCAVRYKTVISKCMTPQGGYRHDASKI